MSSLLNFLSSFLPYSTDVLLRNMQSHPESLPLSTFLGFASTWVLLQKKSRVASKVCSALDHLAIAFTSLHVQFYSKGLGHEELYRKCVEELESLIKGEAVVSGPDDLHLGPWQREGEVWTCLASFRSPIAHLLPSSPEMLRANVEIICPGNIDFRTALKNGNPNHYLNFNKIDFNFNFNFLL